MSTKNKKLGLKKVSSSAQITEFLNQVSLLSNIKSSRSRGRLLFAMDATASREPAWDRACHMQAEMFHATDGLGGLEVQLAFFRGYGECKTSSWFSSASDLVRLMQKVKCVGGRTQLCKILRHTVRETKEKHVDALVFVGDSFEEDIDEVCDVAGELGVHGVPVFVFQEGADDIARIAFQQIVRLTKGAHCNFDLSSAKLLRDLLSAVAVFAAGGYDALENFSGRTGRAEIKQIASQLK